MSKFFILARSYMFSYIVAGTIFPLLYPRSRGDKFQQL
ncbi:hypothetical protein L249_8371 [Ophiocordyceps polyrhachis-furcata BCC 54312]|uniref:Uncharacterized protein n=1 Tax=Ophiocordyceps polyrhachis-furcata BCC 54312 TaxID=1330021 RepID=A0A367KYW0_9HYPO|nr:hypothetical protein L249_8371 [Ophiocordyceps polyrhachis-furcata BCC 54312]